MKIIKYVQSFSSGQITIPKLFRDKLKMSKKFWLKMYISADKIVAEPVEKIVDKTGYQKKLLDISGDWVNSNEVTRNRRKVEKQMAQR